MLKTIVATCCEKQKTTFVAVFLLLGLDVGPNGVDFPREHGHFTTLGIAVENKVEDVMDRKKKGISNASVDRSADIHRADLQIAFFLASNGKLVSRDRISDTIDLVVK